MHTPNGPGGYGSIPALVMRTGLIQPVDPANARRDISPRHVADVTRWPVDESAAMFPVPGSVPTATPVMPTMTPTQAAVAQTVTALPPTAVQAAPVNQPLPFSASDRHHWHTQHRRTHPMIAEINRLHPKTAGMHGSGDVELGEWEGRPLARFEIAAQPTPAGAQVAGQALCSAARALRAAGLSMLPPEMIGGPLAALMRGGAVELHFQNGAVIQMAL